MTGEDVGTFEGGPFETFDANRWFVVARDDEGYGVWRLDDLEEPGPDRALRRRRRLPIGGDSLEGADDGTATPALAPEAQVGGHRVGDRLGDLHRDLGDPLPRRRVSVFEGTGLYDTLSRWSQLVSMVAMPLTLGGFACYAVLWLESRRS